MGHEVPLMRGPFEPVSGLARAQAHFLPCDGTRVLQLACASFAVQTSEPTALLVYFHIQYSIRRQVSHLQVTHEYTLGMSSMAVPVAALSEELEKSQQQRK